MKRQLCLLLTGAVVSTAPMAGAVDNVILFIGDGMGFQHVKAARAYVKGTTSTPLEFETLGVAAESVTTLPDGTVTDLATAGTALATGYQHPVNGIIGMGYNNAIKTNLVELAKAKGMRTAIITTDEIGGATPGAFGAHEPDRTLTAAIRADYLRDDTAQGHAASLPDVLLGGGYNDPTLLPGASYSFVDQAQRLKYQVASTAGQMDAAVAGTLIGLFSTSWAPMTPMVSRPVDSTQPKLSQMLAKALQMLEGPGGFFIVVESANIDKLSHSKDPNFVLEVVELNEAVKVAKTWADGHTLYDNTMIFVTADHETGGLSVKDQSNGVGIMPDMTFSTIDHTAQNVPFFAVWPSVNGLILDNTDTFFLVQDAMYFKDSGYAPVLTGLAVSGVTETGATVQWTTVEPSSSQVQLAGGGKTFSFSGPGPYSHSVTCLGLDPGTTYSVTAASTDLAGKSGTTNSTFTTSGGNPNAVVIGEPVITLGTVSGTYNGVLAAGDGLKQTFIEAADGVGAGVTVDYTLRSPVPVTQIGSLTINGSYTWTGGSTTDGMRTYIRVTAPEGGYLWEQIAFPFVAEPVSSYLDASGNIVVHFEDAASIKREAKDTLAIDSLFGTVVKSTADAVMPTAPLVTAAVPTGPSVSLGWSGAKSQTGFQVWRYNTASNWKLLTELGATASGYTDTTVAASTSYSYVVRAFNPDAYADSQAVAVNVPAPVVVLAAPSNLKVSIVKGTVTLTWTDSNTGETGYRVLRSTTGTSDSFSTLATLGANATKYSDKAVTRGTTYYYQVQAISGTQSGPVSTIVNIKP